MAVYFICTFFSAFWSGHLIDWWINQSINLAPKPINHCDSQPCFPGVHCQPLADTYRCGSCPPGFTGDGERCQPNFCDPNPCYPGEIAEENKLWITRYNLSGHQMFFSGAKRKYLVLARVKFFKAWHDNYEWHKTQAVHLWRYSRIKHHWSEHWVLAIIFYMPLLVWTWTP